MAFKNSPSSGQLAPKGKGRLAAFSAQVEAVASGQSPKTDMALAALELALNKRNVMRCSQLWKTFAQQVESATEQQRLAFRVLPPSQDLPPLP